MLNQPLQGVKVLDLTRVLSGPFCTMLLADMGAEVIKIERPGRGDDSRHFSPFKNQESGYYMALNRGKKSLTLNLKHEEGKNIFKNLVKEADVLVENFKPGVMEKLDLNYEKLNKINPQLIYCSVSGFGQTSPYSKRPAYDLVAQAMGGIMSITGFPENPPLKAGSSIADMSAGLFSAYGISLALLSRHQTGQGQFVDVSMVDSIFSLLESNIVQYTIGDKVPERRGNSHPISAPFDTFQARDGYIVIAIANDSLFEKFANVIDYPELPNDERFETDAKRLKNNQALKEIIEDWLQSYTIQEAQAIFMENGIPCAPIWDIEQICNSEHARVREMLVNIEHPTAGGTKIPGNPVKLSATPPVVDTAAPLLGEHNHEILEDILEKSKQEVEALQNNGVI